MRDALESRGVFGAIFFPPATPEKRCLVRFTLNCALGRTELDRVIDVCAEIREEVGMAEWRSTRRKKTSAATEIAAPKQPDASSRRGLLDSERNDRQFDCEGGTDVYRGPARDRAAAAFDNHPAE